MVTDRHFDFTTVEMTIRPMEKQSNGKQPQRRQAVLGLLHPG